MICISSYVLVITQVDVDFQSGTNFLEPQKVKGTLRVQSSSYQASCVTPFTTGVEGDSHLPKKSTNNSPKYAYNVVP